MSKAQKLFLILLFMLTWFAICTQFYLMLQNRIASVTETIIRFFSYFTILSNLLLAVCVSYLLFKSTSIFTKQTIQTAIAVYIFIVGLIYNIVLRQTWNPQGTQKIVDEILHLINPALYIIYWAIFSARHKLKMYNIFYWLLFPFAYMVIVLIHGNFSNFYPYPFLDMNTLSIYKIAVNCLTITVLFIICLFIFLVLGNYIASKKSIVSI